MTDLSAERRDEAAAAVDHRLRLVFHHLDQHLDRALEAARDACGRLARGQAENHDRHRSHRGMLDPVRLDRSAGERACPVYVELLENQQSRDRAPRAGNIAFLRPGTDFEHRMWDV